MEPARLTYSLLCDDIRIEMGNKISLMGVFENVFMPAFPSTLLKFAVFNHWEGGGQYQTQIRIMNPEGRDFAASAPSELVIENVGPADNITFFTNITFDRPGTYVVQTWLDGKVAFQRPMHVHLITTTPPARVH